MWRMIVFGTLSLALAACGGGECDGDHTGTWQGPNQSVELGGSCEFEFTGAGCSSRGTYGSPLSNAGTVRVEIDAVSGFGNCLPAGNYTCAYVNTSQSLTLDCGAGVFGFTR